MPLTHATTVYAALREAHPDVCLWVDANIPTVRMDQVILVTVNDDGTATVTPTRWTVNRRTGNASHPLTGVGTYHLKAWVRGQFGTSRGSVQGSHGVSFTDAAALAADWSAIAASAPMVHAMLFQPDTIPTV